MRLKWSKHIMQCNPMLIERWRNKRSSEDVRWRSFLRWGTVKVKHLETNVPQKILMIRFETKTWLMENQVKLSCFSPVSVHLEIWLQLFWRCRANENYRVNDNSVIVERPAKDLLQVYNNLRERWQTFQSGLNIKYLTLEIFHKLSGVFKFESAVLLENFTVIIWHILVWDPNIETE